LVAGSWPCAAAAYALASVDVTFTAEERADVLAVPVAALVALREGGYGVEVVEGNRSRYVPVETGLFADGLVEISGAGIEEGMTVGMAT
jgi:multidrug efflux pump subunit AcrA (membrane-fusion protein)